MAKYQDYKLPESYMKGMTMAWVPDPDDYAMDAIRYAVFGKDEFLNEMLNGKVKEMNADELLKAKIEERRAEKLFEKKMELFESFGDDECSEGTILRFTKFFAKDGVGYNYAALKTNGNWYLTGRINNFIRGSWEDLVLALISGDFPLTPDEVGIIDIALTSLEVNRSAINRSDAPFDNEPSSRNTSPSYLD
jgi:hypothetical protein